jgi:hypothetical protein
MSQNKTMIWVLILSGFITSESLAAEAKRWTLQEWLKQKNQHALMDQWLMMNSPSPFEFSFKAESFNYKSKTGTDAERSLDSYSGSVSAFAALVGLQGEYENSTEENLTDATGFLSLRLLGDSLQSTSLTVSIGQRSRQFEYLTNKESIKNLATQAVLQVYLSRYFGIKGSYRYLLPEETDSLGQVHGHVSEGGVFLDFHRLRIFGDYFEDIQRMKPASGDVKIRRQGIKTGLQFFF